MPEQPDLSVILIAPHGYEAVRKLVRRLRAQTVADRIELLIVAPRPGEEARRPQLTRNHPTTAGSAPPTAVAQEMSSALRVRLVETDDELSLGAAKALGVRQAAAPIVAFAEDHCYPEPDWAEALLAAHAGPWAAVAPAIGNANPETAVSWANLLIAYGHWLAPARSRELPDVPAHNSSYKRELLLAVGPELDALLGREGSLHAELRARGGRFFLAGEARAYHLNPTRFPAWWVLRFNAGRLYAATRAAAWPTPRRLLYSIGAPLIPLMRLPQLLGQLRAAGRATLLPELLPALLLALLIHSAGEAAGYLRGEGHTRAFLADFEYDRLRQLARPDHARHLEVV
jgi:hypothetical protein